MQPLVKAPLNAEERKISDNFNTVRIAKIRSDMKKNIEAIHANNGKASEIREITRESVKKIQLIISHS